MLNKSEQEKQQGREAFDQVSRRDFLIASGAAVGVPAASLGAFYFGYEAVQGNPVRVGVLGTGDEGNVLLGAINPDYIDVRAIADLRPFNQWRAFHGDHSSPAALAARKGLMSVYGWKTEDEARKHVAVYNDYNELLDNYKKHGIEAIIIALPLHLHAPAAIAAMNKGLHVLTEKLMAHNVRECKEMALAAAENRVHLATGHQRHYNILYQEAVDTIQRGVLGDLHYIRAQWHRSNSPGSDSWQQPMPESVKRDDPQADRLGRILNNYKGKLATARGAEIEKWATLVKQTEMQIADEVLAKGNENFPSAEAAGYESKTLMSKSGGKYERPAIEELIRWRLWKRTGAGLMVELGSHQLDAAGIFISAQHNGEKQHPISVMVAANRPIFGMDREVMDHVACLFEFPAPGYDPKSEQDSKLKVGVQYSTINGNGYQGYGEVVYGTKGTLVLEREADVQLFRDESASKVKASAAAALDTQASGPPQAAAASGPARVVSRGYQEEEEHWSWAIRQNPRPRADAHDEPRPRCHPKVALADAVIAHVTNLAASVPHLTDEEIDASPEFIQKAAREGARIKFAEEWFDPMDPATPEGLKPDLSRYA